MSSDFSVKRMWMLSSWMVLLSRHQRRWKGVDCLCEDFMPLLLIIYSYYIFLYTAISIYVVGSKFQGYGTRPKGGMGRLELILGFRGCRREMDMEAENTISIALRVLTKSNKNRYDSYCLKAVPLVSLRLWSDNVNWNSCIYIIYIIYIILYIYILYIIYFIYILKLIFLVWVKFIFCVACLINPDWSYAVTL